MSDDKGEQPSSPSLGTKSGFADPLLEFLTQAEDKERKGQSKTPAPKNSVAGDFKKLEEVDGDDFLSLVAQHAKKKPPTKSAYQVQEEELEKELSAPFAEPPRPVLSQMIDEFDSLWEKENESDLNFDLLNLKAQKGGLQNTKLRGLCWKIFLGVIKTKTITAWTEELQAYRNVYDALTQEYLIDPHKSDKDVDLQLNNPLSLATDSPWQRYFQDTELKKQIRLDIIRVYPERAFFKDEGIRDTMLRILFIYARENPGVVYKQGMHELLAPILYVLDREKVSASDASTDGDSETQRLISMLNDQRYVEHDAYAMFNKVMDVTSKWFVSNHSHQPMQANFHDTPFSAPEDPLDMSSSSPVVQKCKRIQQELLRRSDPELYEYLTEMDMEPQLYALRWVRLLLGREFHLEDVLILWDAIFSYGKDLMLVDYIIVAMLIYIRSHLLHKEQQECLHRLFNYPPVEDVLCLIERGLQLLNPSAVPTVFSKEKKELPLEQAATDPLSAVSPVTNHHTPETTPVASPPTTKPEKKKSKTKKSIMATLNSIISDSPKENNNKAPAGPTAVEQQLIQQQNHIQALEQRQSHMAFRLERIIYTIQAALATVSDEDTKEAHEERKDAMLLALAELKQVRDTMAGLLSENEEIEQEAAFFDPLNATSSAN